MAASFLHMPRRQRLRTAGVIFHAMNRAAKRATIFTTPDDYVLLEQLAFEAQRRFQIRIFCYCVMPNHWHFVLRSDTNGELSRMMHWMTGTHAQRWHRAHESTGTGAVYQGRFRAIPVECDYHFLRVCRYVERNPVRAQLVTDVTEWRWSSLWRRLHGLDKRSLAPWPVRAPTDWVTLLRTEPGDETEEIRRVVARNAPFGNSGWQTATAGQLGLEHSLRNPGRPRKERDPSPLLDIRLF